MVKMDGHAFSLRAAQVFTKQVTCLKILLIPLILVIFYYYFFIGVKNVTTIFWKKNASDLLVQTEPIIKVHNLKTYLVGSYVEHRQAGKIIRTIAIVLRSEKAEYQCLLYCNKMNFTVPATYSIHPDHFNFDYGTADIFCQVPEMCKTPTHTSITSRSPSNNRSLQNIHIFQPIRNQQTHDVFPYEFTVCISTMFDYFNVLNLVQAMEMFKILGVQRVAIYKTNCNPDVQKVLDYYVKQNFVEIIPWTISSYLNVSRGWQKRVSPGELHYFGQIAALNDCVYRYMYQSRYVSLQDLDEFILPIKLQNWTELLPELERKYGQKASFIFQNNIFPLYINKPNAKYSSESWKKVVGENILEHIDRLNNYKEKYKNFKVIANPRLVITTSVHGLLKSFGGSFWVDPEIAKIYHFKNVTSKTIPTHSLIQDTHIRDYADRLMPAVTKVLQQALDVH